MSTRSRLRLRTLGSLTLSTVDAPLSGSATAARRLALLSTVAAVEPDAAVSRDTLLLLFWPDRTDDRARSALKQLMFAIRKSVGEDDLFVGSGALRLNPDVISSDVGDLLTAARRGDDSAVVAAYGGPFLDGVHVSDAPEFERWAAERRSTIDALYRSARASLAADADRRGDVAAATVHWTALVQSDRLSATAVAGLATALARSGDAPLALKTIAAHAALVRAEFDHDQEPPLRDLADRIRAGAITRVESAPSPRLEADSRPRTMERGDRGPIPIDRAPAPTPAPRHRRARRVLLLGLAFLAAVIGTLSFTHRSQPGSDLMVVPPFANETGDSSLDPIAMVLANTLSEDLAATGMIPVGDFGTLLHHIPKPNARGADIAIAVDEARRLGAGFAVLGNVRQRHDSLVVSARLIRLSDNRVMSVIGPFVGVSADLDRLIAVASQAVKSASLALNEGQGAAPGDFPSRPAATYAAQLEYTLGLSAAATNTDDAVRHFHRSIELDTTFAAPKFQLLTFHDPAGDSVLASLNRQRAYLTRPQQIQLEIYNAWARSDLEDAYQWAERSVAAANPSPADWLVLQQAAWATNRFRRTIDAGEKLVRYPAWAHQERVPAVNAYHMAGEFELALREAKEQHARNPRNWLYCAKIVEQYAALDRVVEADSVAASCSAVPVTNPDAGADRGVFYLNMGEELLAHGHEREADRAFDRCAELRREFAQAHPTWTGRAGLASQCLFERGDWPHAYELLRTEYLRFQRTERGHMELGVAAAHVGDTATANAMLRWHEERSTNYEHLWYRAAILVALGKQDDAIQLLRRAVTGSVPAAYSHLNNVRAFQPVANDPRYRALVDPRD